MFDLFLAIAIWIVLIGFAGLATLALLARTPRARQPEVDPAPLAVQSAELGRYAGEVGVAAERAARMAHRRREEWLAAQAKAEEAWLRFEAGDTAMARLGAAAAYPLPETPAEPEEGKRYLRRAAMAACARRQITALELSDILAHRGGWDPERHPVEQEIVLQRAIRDGLFQAYRAAAAREREAWQAANQAAAGSASLRDEAFAARGRARRVSFACAAARREQRRRQALARMPALILSGR